MGDSSKWFNRMSLRLPGHDYSEPGAYFITICTQNRLSLFGEIVNHEMILNDNGRFVLETWNQLPERYLGIKTDEFIVMPDHIHGIIIITGDNNPVGLRGKTRPSDITERRRMLLSKIIGYFKMNTAKWVNQKSGTPGHPIWQRNYYEHVIRTSVDQDKIRQYIADNPRRLNDSFANRMDGMGVVCTSIYGGAINVGAIHESPLRKPTHHESQWKLPVYKSPRKPKS